MVLLSLQSTKRDIYLLPLYPLAAILAAHAAHRLAGAPSGEHTTHAVAGVGVFCALCTFAAPLLAHASFLPLDASDLDEIRDFAQGALPFALGAAGTLVLAGSLAAWSWAARPAAALRVMAIGFAAAWLIVGAAVVPSFDAWKSLRSAVAAGEAAAPGAPLAIGGSTDASPLWAFHRPRLLETNPFSYREAAGRLAAASPRILLIAKTKWWSERGKWAGKDVTVLDRATVVWERTIGGTGYVLLTNAPPP